MYNHPATFQAARIRSITPSRGTKTPTTIPTVSETISRLCAHNLVATLVLFAFRGAMLFSVGKRYLENQRQLALHFRFSLPEAQLAAHFHEACRILCGAEFNAARVEVGSNSRLLEERHGIGRISDELAMGEGIGNEILCRRVFGLERRAVRRCEDRDRVVEDRW